MNAEVLAFPKPLPVPPRIVPRYTPGTEAFRKRRRLSMMPWFSGFVRKAPETVIDIDALEVQQCPSQPRILDTSLALSVVQIQHRMISSLANSDVPILASVHLQEWSLGQWCRTRAASTSV
jgi:hypothetical protein